MEGWYRIALAPHPGEPQAAYLQRISTNARVYLNDEYVGSGGSFEEPISRNMHRPLFFALPRSAWQDADNYLYVQLRVYPGYAHLGGLRVGDEEVMRPTFERQFYIQNTLSQILFFLALVAAIFGFLFWLMVERTSTNLFFALTATSWSIYCMNLFIRDIPIPAKAWWALIHSNLEWAGVFMVFFSHRLLGRRRPWIEIPVTILAITATITYLTIDLVDVNPTASRFHLILLLFAAQLMVWLCWRAYRDRNTDALVVGLCLVGVVVLGSNDLIRQSVPIDDPNWQTPFYLLQFGAPGMFIILASYLITRYVRAQRVALTAGMEQERAKQTERERIYQDLHDDVGAKLLSLIYQSESEEERELARSALEDIRDIVSGKADEAVDLLSMFDIQCAEIEERLIPHDIALKYAYQIDSETIVTGQFAYHVSRILRELISNTIKHAEAHNVNLDATESERTLTIQYADDGRGLTGEETPGRGLAGIRRRTQALGGRVTKLAGENGFEIALKLPLAEGV